MNMDDYEGFLGKRKPVVITDKTQVIRTFLHYSDSDANKTLTVFGSKKRDLFYNYDDRLIGEKWIEGLKLAEKQAEKDTARYYEIALSHFHDAEVDLQHIILGCNRSSGYSYLVFGYTY